MAETAQKIGHGSKFQLGDGATPEVFTDIEGVLSVDLGSNKIDQVDITDFGTPANQRTYVGGLETPGVVTVKLNVKPGNPTQQKLEDAKDSAIHNFKVIYPGAARTLSFAGVITGLDESIPDDKLPTYSCTVQVSGTITRA